MAERASDPLRLDVCPACGYALEGLPEVGRCPECGADYRPGVIVLHGFGRGISTGRTRSAWTSVAINVVVGVYFAARWRRDGRVDAFEVIYPAYLVFWTGWAVWKRWWSDMPGLVQVWLGPDGARQVDNPTAGDVKRGQLTPWRQIVEAGVKSVNDRTARLRLVGPTTFWRGKQVISLEFDCDAARAAALREQIAVWRAADPPRKSAGAA